MKKEITLLGFIAVVFLSSAQIIDNFSTISDYGMSINPGACIEVQQSNINVFQKLDSVYIQRLDTTTGYWNIYQKKEYTYGANSDTFNIYKYLWDDGNKKWLIKTKRVYTQDKTGNLKQLVEYGWRGGTLKWFLGWEENYLYNIDNKLIEKTVYSESAGQLSPYKKSDYSYLNGNTIEYENMWDSSDSIYRLSSKREYNFDSTGNISGMIVHSWSRSGNVWNPSFKIDYLKDSYGRINLYRLFLWEKLYTSWEVSSEGDFSYDKNGNLFEYIEWSKDEGWKFKFRINFDCDTMNTLNGLLLPPRFLSVQLMNGLFNTYDEQVKIMFNNIVNSRIRLTSYPASSTKEIYFYSGQSRTPAQNTVNSKYRLYPNPAKDFVEIDIDSNDDVTFELYDLRGRSILKKAVCNSEKVFLRTLPTGIYIYNLYVNDEKISGKLLKE